MKLINSLLSLIAPSVCVGCGLEGSGLCVDCSAGLIAINGCYKCGAQTKGSLTCLKCRTKSSLAALYVTSAYRTLSKDLVWRAKYASDADVARRMGAEIAKNLPHLVPDEVIIVPVPTTPARRRERGFDQAHIMAAEVAKYTSTTMLPAIARVINAHQVGSTRKERLEHMVHGFEPRHSMFLEGKTVVLVDDVLTTGATIEAAARAVRKAGAKRVIGAVFARVA